MIFLLISLHVIIQNLLVGVRLGDINPLRLKEMTSTYRLLGLVQTKQKINYEDFIYRPLSEKNISLSDDEKEYIYEKGKLKICVEENDMPYQGIEQVELVGMSADFLSMLRTNLDVSFEVVHVKDYEEAKKFLKDKKCDILPTVKLLENNKIPLHVTSSYVDIPMVLVSDKGKSYMSDLISVKKALQDNLLDDAKLDYNTNKHLTIHMAVEDKMLFNVIEKYIKTIGSNKKRSILYKWTNAIYVKSIDYTFVWIFLVIAFAVLVFFYMHQRRLNILLEKKTAELNTQMEIFENNISSSSTD